MSESEDLQTSPLLAYSQIEHSQFTGEGQRERKRKILNGQSSLQWAPFHGRANEQCTVMSGVYQIPKECSILRKGDFT